MAKSQNGHTPSFNNEGHEKNSQDPRLSKGQFQGVGTYVDLTHSPTSANSKTNHTGTGEE